MTEKYRKPNANQSVMIRRRNLDPKNYRVVKDTWCNLYLLDIRYKKVKIIYKHT